MSPPSSPPSEESEATTDPILVERRALAGTKGGYLLVTLNRPRHSNAMNNATLQELQAVFDRLPADKWVRAVVLTGAGHAFCGGHDLYQMHDSQGDKQYFERMFARCSRFMLSIQRVPQPVLAAVNGLATGAGRDGGREGGSGPGASAARLPLRQSNDRRARNLHPYAIPPSLPSSLPFPRLPAGRCL